jgi:hypothetical protein
MKQRKSPFWKPQLASKLQTTLSIHSRVLILSMYLTIDKSRKACFIVQQAHSLGQTLLIQVHDLWDLPCIRNATTGTAILPTAFITAKTDKDVKDKKKAKAATHVHIPARYLARLTYYTFIERHHLVNIYFLITTNLMCNRISRPSI